MQGQKKKREVKTTNIAANDNDKLEYFHERSKNSKDIFRPIRSHEGPERE
jgi:hypothetical protein